jgi:hypothetical protein
MLILSLIEQRGITKRPFLRHDYLPEEVLLFWKDHGVGDRNGPQGLISHAASGELKTRYPA